MGLSRRDSSGKITHLTYQQVRWQTQVDGMAEDLDARLTYYVAARFLVAFGVDEVTIVQVHSVVPGEHVRILKPAGLGVGSCAAGPGWSELV